MSEDAVNAALRSMGFLNAQMTVHGFRATASTFLNEVIAYEELFKGTIDQTAVYPREILKHTVLHNAFAVVLSHSTLPGSLTQARQTGSHCYHR